MLLERRKVGLRREFTKPRFKGYIKEKGYEKFWHFGYGGSRYEMY